MRTPTTTAPLEWEGFVQPINAQYAELPPDVPARTMRAIYHPDSCRPLEFLGDRMADRGDVKPLFAWLKKHSHKIQSHFTVHGPNSGSCDWCKYDADGGHFHGTPNASYGYCYCVAWLDKPTVEPQQPA